jgi:glycosyltransferase involved in cell wall biosynthesis
MPAYNEEGSIRQAVEDVYSYIVTAVSNSELIVIDDGSRDSTPIILDELAQIYQIRVVHQENRGHGGALLKGLSLANGRFLFLLDSDRQIPLESFKLFWQRKDESDCVFGVRVNRRSPTIRLVLSQIVRWSVNLLFSVELRDPNAPFKLLNRKVWDSAKSQVPPETLAPSILIAVYGAKKFRIAQIDVPHCARLTGCDSLPPKKLLLFCARAFAQLLSFKQRLKT